MELYDKIYPGTFQTELSELVRDGLDLKQACYDFIGNEEISKELFRDFIDPGLLEFIQKRVDTVRYCLGDLLENVLYFSSHDAERLSRYVEILRDLCNETRRDLNQTETVFCGSGQAETEQK